MLSYLPDFEYLFGAYGGPLRLFRYITFRSAMAAFTALIIGMVIAPYVIAWLHKLKFGQAFRTKEEVGKLAELHSGKKGTPTMGGLMIYVSVTLSTLLWAKPNLFILTALFVYTGLTIIGFLDDYFKVVKKIKGGLKGIYKIIGQALITAVSLILLLSDPDLHAIMSELWVPFLKDPLIATMPIWMIGPFLFLVLAGSSNAINLTDGVDGLAIGCTITVALTYGIIAYATGHAVIADYLFIRFVPGVGELSVLCAALVAGGLAFLWYNAHPAQVFMGDTGSLAIGGLIGIVAFMTLQPVTLILVGGIFVMEAMSVIIQVISFKTRGKRVFLMSPIHHHFELKGWAETKVVIRFWILSLIFALAGLSTLKLR
ncbi:MAG: phospho-N-acetylmuramoyl-pentapeptide-transferase [Verrucomicrobiota bacterium]|nr:phospho-N-acetylmuramoyl-pentapeptide-transferase [Verrucomicrobiota bacterium]